MRARRGRLVGWLAVAGYAVLLLAVALAAARAPDHPRTRPEPVAEDVAERLIAAWERSRLATFVTSGTYERRSDVSGAAIASEDVVAQRPPVRVHRQLGGVEGRDDDRLLVCPAPPAGQEDDRQPCRLGTPGRRTYAEAVADEVAGLRSLLQGPTPLYRVADGRAGCFDLELLRIDPRAPFGVEASFCFDPDSGAPAGSRVRHEGGIEEVVVVTDIRTDVTDADLEP
jgi:hypothetical protein